VVVFDHIVRISLLAERHEKGVRAPARIVPNDYSFKSAPRRVRDLLPEEADRLLKSRFAEIKRLAQFAARSNAHRWRSATPAA
jgi:hypothetical protein